MVVNKKDVEEHHQIIDVLTKKQQELVKETKNNILSERTFQALENLFNVIDVEIKRFNQSNMMKSAMENAYNIIQENKRKTNNKTKSFKKIFLIHSIIIWIKFFHEQTIYYRNYYITGFFIFAIISTNFIIRIRYF